MAALVISGGCRDYVEIDEVGSRILYYTEDYQILLNNTNTFESTFYLSELASDDIAIDEGAEYLISMQTDERAYTWADQIWIDANDTEWNRLYEQVSICNEIIDGVMSSEGGSEAERRDILAQAKVHRAYAYFCLVNIYAKQYDDETAATDLGVPLLLTPDFFVDLTRASVAAVYEQLEKDLTEAIADLPLVQLNTQMPSRAAAYGTLSRVYLQKEQYELANAYADSTLAIQSELLNLADYEANRTSLPQKYDDPETIFLKRLSNYSINYQLNPELLDLFDDGDLRYSMFTDDGSALSWNPSPGRTYTRPAILNQGIFSGPNVPEMMLIKAEYYARAGETVNALSELNDLRESRFAPENFQSLTATNADEALSLVIDERRMEFMGRGYRWFDQKRLNKDSRFAATVVHHYQGETYTLEPNSLNYVFPISETYIVLNPEIEQNPRD